MDEQFEKETDQEKVPGYIVEKPTMDRIISPLNNVLNRELDPNERSITMIGILQERDIPAQLNKVLFDALETVVKDKNEHPYVRGETLNFFIRLHKLQDPELRKRAFDILQSIVSDKQELVNSREKVTWAFGEDDVVPYMLGENQEENERILNSVYDQINQEEYIRQERGPSARASFMRALKHGLRSDKISPEVKEKFIERLKENLFDKEEQDLLLRKESVFALYSIFKSKGISEASKRKIWSALDESFKDRGEEVELRKEPSEVFEYIVNLEGGGEFRRKSFSELQERLFDKQEDPVLRAHVGWVMASIAEKSRSKPFRNQAEEALAQIRVASEYQNLLQFVKTDGFTGKKRIF